MNSLATVDHYENFPVASWLCPAPIRGAVSAIYHFARTADDLADEGEFTATERLAALARYRRSLTAMHDETVLATIDPAWQPIFAELNRQVRKHALPLQPLHDLLSAFEQDVPNPLHADRASLMDYCSRSANPVGRLLLHLYGLNDDVSLRQSDAVCSALQLTNFWQDVSIDLPRGRCYFPLDDLRRRGLSAPLEPTHDIRALQSLTAELVTWTRALMLQGAPLALRVPGRGGWELRLVVQGGLRILDKIEAHGCATATWRPRLKPRDALAMFWRAVGMRSIADSIERGAPVR